MGREGPARRRFGHFWKLDRIKRDGCHDFLNHGMFFRGWDDPCAEERVRSGRKKKGLMIITSATCRFLSRNGEKCGTENSLPANP
jgi:hypothetical protein